MLRAVNGEAVVEAEICARHQAPAALRHPREEAGLAMQALEALAGSEALVARGSVAPLVHQWPEKMRAL